MLNTGGSGHNTTVSGSCSRATTVAYLAGQQNAGGSRAHAQHRWKQAQHNRQLRLQHHRVITIAHMAGHRHSTGNTSS
jgi:hypothetical protein